MGALRMHLFGGFLLERDGVALPPIASRVGRSIFAYLVMHRDRPIHRDLLGGIFWPDLPESKARKRLSQTLWQIQDVVNEGSVSQLSVTTDTIAFDTARPYWLDVEAFDQSFDMSAVSDRDVSSPRRVDPSALRACVELYRGDFLAGFFDDWVVVDQDLYRQRYIFALRHLVDATKADGAYEEALAHARRLTHHDPLSEGVHQEVMRLCFLLGRTNEAVEQYERCRSILAEELGSEPSQSMVELYERIIRQRKAGIHPSHELGHDLPLNTRLAAPFVGREEERRELVDSMERVLAGPGGVALVEGEPGVGKTRLALEAGDDAQWRGFHVSWGTCTPGALRPFAPLVEVLESLSQLRVEQLSEQVAPVWLQEALRLAPRLSGDKIPSGSAPLRPAEESTRMKEALVHTLGALGTITPHVVIIDDVQWADRDTLSVLTQLGPRLANSRILLMLLYRSEEARGDPEIWDVLRELDRVAGLERVVLSPLSVFELDDMVKRILGVARLEPQVAAQLHRRTGGNALFTLETLRALRDQGLFDVTDPGEVLRRQLSEIVPVAPRVRSVIDARISLLGDVASTVYEVAAVSGDAADLSLLSAGADLPRTSVLDAVDELLHRGLVRDTGDGRYQIAHDQVRQVVYERTSERRRIVLHRRVGEALEAVEPMDVEAIGHHFRLGNDAERATPYLLMAGLRAARLNAYATANQHLQEARSLASDASWSPEERCRLLGELESVLSVLGRRSEQEEVIDEMAMLAESVPEIKGDVERRRTWLLAHSADFQGAEASGIRSVDSEKQRGDRSSLAAALVALGTAVRWSGRPLDAVPYLDEAIGAASTDEEKRADALTELASTLVEVQQSAGALPRLEQALEVYEEHGNLRGEAEVAGIQARAFHQQGDIDLARTRYQRAIELCQQIGYRYGEGVHLVNLSLVDHMLGRVADALPGYDRAERIFTELDNVRGEAMVLANASSARHVVLGDDVRALADAKRARGLFADIGDRAREAQCLEIIAGVASRQGRHEEAKRLLEDSLEALSGTGNRFLEGQHLRSLALLQLDVGEYQDAFGILDRADEVCVDVEFKDLAVELLSIRGMAWLGVGREADALDHTRRSVESLTPGVERPYLVYWRHFLAATAVGAHPEARQSALRAHETLESTLSGLSGEDRKRSLERVPEHAEIVAAASRLTPQTIQVFLPASHAPAGGRLIARDLRKVTWTVEHPEDDRFVSPIEKRRGRVLRMVAEAVESGAIPSIDHLANALGVSESTVGRDLSELRRAGHVVSTRGHKDRAS